MTRNWTGTIRRTKIEYKIKNLSFKKNSIDMLTDMNFQKMNTDANHSWLTSVNIVICRKKKEGL